MKLAQPMLLVAVGRLAVCGALWWPVPLALDSVRVHTAFADSHVWVLAQVAGEVSDCAAGYPRTLSMRPIAWVPLRVAAVLRPVLGTLGAMNAAPLLSSPVSGVVAGVWLHKATAVDRWTASAAGCVLGTVSHLLGHAGYR